MATKHAHRVPFAIPLMALVLGMSSPARAQLNDFLDKLQKGREIIDRVNGAAKSNPSTTSVGTQVGLPSGKVTVKVLWEHETISSRVLLSPDLAQYADVRLATGQTKIESSVWNSPVLEGTATAEFLSNGSLFTTVKSPGSKHYYINDQAVGDEFVPMASSASGVLFAKGSVPEDRASPLAAGVCFLPAGKGILEVKTSFPEANLTRLSGIKTSSNGRFAGYYVSGASRPSATPGAIASQRSGRSAGTNRGSAVAVFDFQATKTLEILPLNGAELAGVLDDGSIVLRGRPGFGNARTSAASEDKYQIVGKETTELPGSLMLVCGNSVLTRAQGFDGDEFFINGKLWAEVSHENATGIFDLAVGGHICGRTKGNRRKAIREDGKSFDDDNVTTFNYSPYWGVTDISRGQGVFVDLESWSRTNLPFEPAGATTNFYVPGLVIDSDPKAKYGESFIRANGQRLSPSYNGSIVKLVHVQKNALRLVIESFKGDRNVANARRSYIGYELTW